MTSSMTARREQPTRSEKRGSVIRGLIAVLEPWEHSRRVQRAALLVLGNVFGNALEEDSEMNAAAGGSGAAEACAVEIDQGLKASRTGGEEERVQDDDKGCSAR